MINNTKIAIIKQKTSYLEKQNIQSYFEKVMRIANRTKADIIIGPELSLSSSIEMMPLSYLKEKVEDFSKCLKGKLILPGTGLAYESETKSMCNIAPIMFKDGSIKYVEKNSSHVEDLIAESRGLNYKRGNLQDRIFSDQKNEENFVVEICRDHGIGKLKQVSIPNINFQFILANNLLGISPEKTFVKNGGIVVLAEGEKPRNSWAYKKIKGDLLPLRGNETPEYVLFN
jgi:hypothetical protein